MATVLIGDHVPDIRTAMTMVFQRRGHEVFSIGEAASVMAAVLEVRPAVLLLNLPDDDAVQGVPGSAP